MVGFLLLVLATLGCAPTPPSPDSSPIIRTQYLLGTTVDITVFAADRPTAMAASSAGFAEIARLEAIFSTYRDDSEVTRLNEARGEWVVVSPETILVLREAIRLGDLSGGAFDVTVGPLMLLWREAEAADRLPSEDEIAEVLERVDRRHIIIDEPAPRVRLEGGARIDLGGIAKGYIVDRASEVMVEKGADGGVVNAGGDLRYAGRLPPEIRKARVADPADPGRVAVSFPVGQGAAVATSGNYERAFEIGGRRYGHILDPRTGRPVEGPESVTVVATTALLADALATAIFVGGSEVVVGWAPAADARRREGATWPEGVERICIIQRDGIYQIREDGVVRLER